MSQTTSADTWKIPGTTLKDWATIATVILVALGSTLFVNDSMVRIREALPREVLQQQRDMAEVAHSVQLLAAMLGVDRNSPPARHLEEIRDSLARCVAGLRAIRRDYNFNTLTGASAMHALVNPAIEDIERWMQSGVSGLPPESDVTLQLAHRRAMVASSQASALLERTNRSAASLLDSEVIRIEFLRASIVIFILTLAAIATALVGLLIRQRNTRIRLAIEHARLSDSMENMEQAFALFDRDERLVVCNQHYRDLYSETGVQPTPGDGLRDLVVRAIDAKLISSIDEGTSDLLSRYAAHHERPGDGFEVHWRDGRYFRVTEHTTHEGGIICVCTDITEFKQAQQRMEYLATHDELTGLPGRRHFERTLTGSINRAVRHGHRVSVMFIDIDRFKWINDTHGHVAGDRFLDVMGQRLRECVRDHDLVARLGGDEFAIVLEETDSWQDVAASAQRVLDTLAAPVKFSSGQVHGTVSIGIASFPQDGQDLARLVKHADDACYHAKASGRANYQFYTERINLEAARRHQVESRLRLALHDDLLDVHYQPQVAVDAHIATGLEALVRWEDEELGKVTASELVAVAEETGLGAMLVSRVLTQVVRDVRRWHSQGIDVPRVWVNVSASQLNNLDLAIGSASNNGTMDESMFGVEITESMLVDDPSGASDALGKLSQLGVKLAIDDFGVGYSSLAALKDYPLDALKIDASFVRNVCDNPHDVQIVRAIVSLAHSLSLKVVAEGVETVEQLQTLNEHGVDEIQGHLVSQAISANNMARWLRVGSYEPVAGGTASG